MLQPDEYGLLGVIFGCLAVIRCDVSLFKQMTELVQQAVYLVDAALPVSGNKTHIAGQQ